jgi:hypothetical protein
VARRLKGLEDKNRRFKKLLAEAMLDNAALKDLLGKKRLKPAARRLAVASVIERHGLSQCRACRLIGIDHSVWRYRSRRPDDGLLRQRLRELAQHRRRFGYRRLGWLLSIRRPATISSTPTRFLNYWRPRPSAPAAGAGGRPSPHGMKSLMGYGSPPQVKTTAWWQLISAAISNAPCRRRSSRPAARVIMAAPSPG